MSMHTQNGSPPAIHRSTEFAPTTASGTLEPLLAPLRYEPLPKPTSIRLLEILPSPESQIWCSLTTVDLDDEPAFDALSYTWGNPITVHEKCDQFDIQEDFKEFEKCPESQIPGQLLNFDLDAWQFREQHPFIPYEKVEWNAERKYPIQCNGSAYMVTENLIHALQVLRRWRFGNFLCTEGFDAMTGHPISRHIWIDMICINQENVDERNLQIRVMGRIFQSARTVIGWLGPEANQSRHASAAFGHFLETLVKEKSAYTILTPSVYALFSIKGISEKDVYAIFSLFQRLWFRRAWIVQEAVLARKLILSCGGVLVQWGAIEIIVEILQSHNLYGSLAEFGVALMKGGPTNKSSRQSLKAGAWTFGFRPEQQEWDGKLQVDPVACRNFIMGVRKLRQFFGRETVYRAPRRPQLDTPKPPSSDTEPLTPPQHQEELMSIFDGSGREALDAQPGWHENLLYLFRSCSASDPRDKIFSLFGILEQSGSQIPDIPWDYRIGVQDLYVATVSSIIRATNRLDILAQVQDPSWTKVPGLPSWIPDFSVDFRAVLFDDPMKPVFAASSLQSLCEPIFNLMPRLQVEGFLVDNIICVAPSRGCYFVRTAIVVSGLPSHYHPGRPCSKDSPTRAEAYWRTLLADVIAGVHPAPLEFGFDFSSWVAEELLRAGRQQELIWKWRRQTSGTSCEQSSNPPYDKRLEKKFYWWWALALGETGEFVPLEKLKAMENGEASVAKLHNTGVEAKGSSANASKPIRFLPDAEYLNSCTTRNLDPNKMGKYRQCTKYPRSERMPTFRARLAEVKRGHRMFRTTNDYLGLGPISSDTGDELWILRGARTPFVLRRRDDGQYQLIGEAYVHGIMHGEAVQGNFKPTPLVLV